MSPAFTAGAPEHRPLVVLYLYFHAQGEHFDYPNARARNSARTLAVRYLECALTQVGTLRMQQADCEITFVTNLADISRLPKRGGEILAGLEALNVQVLRRDYTYRPGGTERSYPAYPASRYVFDAVLAAADGQPEGRVLWLTDLDCVWVKAKELLGANPEPGRVGCVVIRYPPDWNTVGAGQPGSRREIQQLSEQLGVRAALPPWIGGELLTGSVGTMVELVRTAEQLDSELVTRGIDLATEEQLLTLAAAQRKVMFSDLSHLARRIQTGKRHNARPVLEPETLAFWHLPGEKGLSMRRTSRELLRRQEHRLARDLTDPALMATRFKVGEAGLIRQSRDIGWIAQERLKQRVLRS